MITDALTTFSNDQAITATANSTNDLDLGAAGMNYGHDIEIVAEVDTTFTAAGAATLTVTLVTDDNAAFSSPTTLLSTIAIPVAQLVAGYRLPINALPNNVERYVRLVYTVATGPFTAGKINAGLAHAAQSNR